MDPRLEQFLQSLNRHRVALGGLAVAIALGAMAGGALKPAGLLGEPMAAQLIASQDQASNALPPLGLEPFPADLANRPWVNGVDYAKATELPRLSAAYDDEPAYKPYETPDYGRAIAEASVMPSTTPSVTEHAVDAVDEAPAADEPAA
jgi:hypothetical protein